MNIQDHDKLLATLSPEQKKLLALRLKRQKLNDKIPLSLSQKRLWFLEQLDPESLEFNVPSAVEFSGDLQIDILKLSINKIIDRHEILRTKILTVDDDPIQVQTKDINWDIEEIDLSGIEDSVKKEKSLQTLLAKNCKVSFNLSDVPLFRIWLIKIGSDKYVLQTVMHHIITDGWSVGNFIKELSIHYNNILNKLSIPLPELSIQYKDYARWQAKWLQSEKFNKYLKFWKEYLGKGSPTLFLPTDYSDNNKRSNDGDIFFLKINSQNVQKIKKITAKNDLTTFIFFAALINVFLHKYSLQNDISIGTPVANRNKKEVQNLIGFFVNLVVLRNQISKDKTFIDFLVDVKRNSLNIFDHQEMPFEILVEELQPDRDLNKTPLFRVMYSYSHSGNSKLSLPNLELKGVNIDFKIAQYDLTFNVNENDHNEIEVGFEYNTCLFLPTTIERMANNFLNLLNSILDDPYSRINDLCLLSPNEINLLENNNRLNVSTNFRTVVDEFEDIVLKFPNKTALNFKKNPINYAELNQKANQFSRYLQSKSLPYNSFIGVFLDNSPSYIISILGILKSGLSFLPIDIKYPKKRIEQILEDSKLNYLVTEEKYISNIKDLNINKIILDLDWSEIKKYNDRNLKTDIAQNAIAYCIYTSGSTGIPKGVLISHSNLATFCHSAVNTYNIEREDKILQFASVSFDTSIEEIFLSLTKGSTLIIKTDEMLADANQFSKIINREEISILDLPTAYWTQLVNEMAADKLKFPSFIKKVIIGGEKVHSEIVKKWYSTIDGNVELLNTYGPTEASVVTTVYKLHSSFNILWEVPIGKPLANYKTYVLDNDLNLVPMGTIGELFIGGDGVGLGYLKKPNLTANYFIPDPYSKKKGQRLYRSGDLVRWNSTGNIEFVGRKDSQIKIRGFRVELGEISSEIKKIPGVTECIVITEEISFNDVRIHAFIKSGEEIKKDVSSFKSILKRKLPSFMIPSSFNFIEEIPLTINGKIDEDKLLTLKNNINTEPVKKIDYSPDEEKLIAIVKEILKLDHVSLNDNFFDIGGHSLLATKLTARLRKEFESELSLRDVFEASDFNEIFSKLSSSKVTLNKKNLIPGSNKNTNIPLSFAQQRLWFLDQIEPESPFYNIPFAVRIKGEFEIDLLKKSVEKVIQRHEILRTTFENNNGKPFQKVQNDFTFDINVVDLMSLQENIKESEARKQCDMEVAKGFKLDKLPLFRVKCLLMAENDFIIVINFHHIISDGWSSDIFVREVSTIYYSLISNVNYQLPNLNIQYKDYSHWQRDWLKDKELEKRVSFWKKYLDNSPKLINLPLDKKRPDIQTFNGNILENVLEKTTFSAVNEINKKYGTTSFMFFLSVFYLLLYRLTNQEDIVIGTPIANRDQPEIQNLIGLFVNTIAIRNNLSECNNFIDLLTNTKTSSIEAFDHKELPFEKILDAIEVDRNVSYSPLFQVMFTFNHFDGNQERIDGIDIKPFEFKSKTSKFDLSLTVQETNDKNYVCGLEYNTDIFLSSTIKRWLNYYNTLVNEIIGDQGNRILNYKLAPGDVLINKPSNFLVEDSLLQKLKIYSKQNNLHPALIFNEDKLTYPELNELVESLCYNFKLQGITEGQFVGVYQERSLEAVTTILALYRLGAAFIPLDTKYPKERIDYILNDSKINYIVCSTENSTKLPEFINKIKYDSYHEVEKIHSESELPYIEIDDNLPAYVIYTSGSSGKPKGVVISRKNINSFINASAVDYSIKDSDKVLQFASLSFDTSLEEIMPILYKGGTLVLRDDEMLSSNKIFLERIEENKISILDLPTAFWHQLTNEMIVNKYQFHPELHTIIIGGEKASKEIFYKWNELFGKKIKLLNTYGPTETTIVASYWSSQSYSEKYFNEVPIGKNLSNSKLLILDNDLNEVPIGVIGQLYICGNSLAIGYLNDPTKTALQFIPNPFSNIEGDRLYKSGDLVRILPSGDLEFIGRADSQVKIRGFRVEITEIENVINSLNLVQEAAVIINSDSGRDKLVCYYSDSSQKEISFDNFRNKLKKFLPDFMIPNNFVKVKEIPKTKSGKIDRKNLSLRKVSFNKKEKEIVPPKSDQEKIIYEVWKDVLSTENFGVTDNFFELGGDSIIGIQIISKVRQKGLVIKPIHLFQYQTIQELSKVAEEGVVIKAEQGLVSGEFPLIPIQQTFLESNFYNNNHWNQSILFKISQNLNLEKLKQTIKILIYHHDAFRLRLNYKKKQIAISNEINEIPFEYFDITNTTDNYKDKIENISQVTQKSLNLEKGPVFKVAYIKVGENEGRILIVVHHFAIDGVSWRVLLEDFQTIYNSLENNLEVNLPPKTSSIKEWANRLNEYSNSTSLSNDYLYWESIAKNSFLFSENDFDGINDEKSTLYEVINFDENLTNNLLTKVNLKYNTKINEILLTALARSYSIWSGKRRLFVNLEGHGRENLFNDIDVSRTIGWFTSIFPLYIDLKKSITVSDTIGIIKDQVRDIPNNGFTFGLLRYLSKSKEYSETLKTLDNIAITFNYLGQFDNILNSNSIFGIAKENKGTERDEKNLRDCLIDVTGSVSNGKLTIAFSYSSNLFRTSSIKKWADLYKTELEEIVNNCLGADKSIHTSSDFELTNLDNKKLNKVLSKLKKK